MPITRLNYKCKSKMNHLNKKLTMNRVFIIGGRSYNVSDPTMRNLSLAGRLIKEEQKKDYDILNEPPRNDYASFADIFNGMPKETLCKVLSVLVSGDSSLESDLLFGEKYELVAALDSIYSEVARGFEKIWRMSKQVCMMAAKPKV